MIDILLTYTLVLSLSLIVIMINLMFKRLISSKKLIRKEPLLKGIDNESRNKQSLQ